MFRSAVAFFIAGLAGIGLAACDQLTAGVQAVSVLTQTPDVADSLPAELKQLTTFNQQDFEPVAGVVVGIGEVANVTEAATGNAEPQPITGAEAYVRWTAEGSEEVALCEAAAEGESQGIEGASEAQGLYLASSYAPETNDTTPCTATELAYASGTTYTTEVETATDVYTMEVEAPAPVAADKLTFAPELSGPESIGGVDLQTHTGGALTLDWSDDPEASKRNVFVTVLRAQFSGDPNTAGSALDDANWTVDEDNPVFDNTPREPQALVDLVLEQPETSVEIEASTFSEPGLYAVVLTPVELSTQTSTNLAIGSGALAGQGTVFTFFVK